MSIIYIAKCRVLPKKIDSQLSSTYTYTERNVYHCQPTTQNHMLYPKSLNAMIKEDPRVNITKLEVKPASWATVH